MQPIQIELSKKKKTFFNFVLRFLNLDQKYGMKKTWLGKCLKMLVSEDLSTTNMLNGLKHYLNLHNISFNTFIDQYD